MKPPFAIRNLLLLPVAFLITGAVNGQKFAYNHYRTGQGLPSDQVRAMARDSIGFLWIATDNGLCRFDGRHFKAFGAHLASRYIKDLHPTSDGDLLLANDAGIFTIHPQRDTARIVKILSAGSRVTDTSLLYPNGIYHDRRERLWVSQPNGAIALWERGRLTFFPFGEDHRTGYSDSDFVFGEDKSGTIWIAAATGQLYRYQNEERSFQRVQLPRPFQRIHDLQMHGDTLWLAGDQLVRGVAQSNGLEDIRYFSSGEREFTSLAFGARGLYLGTRKEGVLLGEWRRGELILQPVFGSNDPHRLETLPFRDIHTIYLDDEGLLWLGSRLGLGLLQTRFFRGVFGLANNNTFSVYTDPDRVLIAFGDVYGIRREKQEFFAEAIPSPRRNFVGSLTGVADTIWMGTTDGRLFAYREDRKVRQIDLSERGSGIFYLYGDRRGALWFCQAPDAMPLKGVSKLTPAGRVQFYDAEEGIDNRILVLKESPRGRLYAAGIGPETYLFRYQPQSDRFINLSLPLPFRYSQNFEVHDLSIDERGVVWLGTTDGLLRFDLERIQRIDLGVYTATEVRAVEAMADGGVWLGTDTHGLLFYRDGKCVPLDEASGLPTKVATYRCLEQDKTGRIWIGTAEGVVYSRDPLPAPRPTPRPLWLSGRINGHKIPGRIGALRINRTDRLSLRFASLTFPADQLLYQYRISGGHDEGWRDAETPGQLQLSNLSRGNYQLDIRARQPGGYTWSHPLSLQLAVRPVWYKRWWAILLYMLLGVAGLTYLIHRQVGRLRRRIRDLQRQLAEREAALRDKQENLRRQEWRHTQDMQDNRLKTNTKGAISTDQLHALFRQLPRPACWREVFRALIDNTSLMPAMNAFEFGYHHRDAFRTEGFVLNEQKWTGSQEAFDEKVNMKVACLIRQMPLLIMDYEREHARYIAACEGIGYASALLLPFQLPGRQPLIWCVYAKSANAFSQEDLMRGQLITDYLAASVGEALAPDWREKENYGKTTL